MLKICYVFALYVISVVFYCCAVFCLWKCWHYSVYLEGLGTLGWQKDYREMKSLQDGIYGIFRVLCRNLHKIHFPQKVESCRVLGEALLFPVFSIFLSGLLRFETANIFSSKEAVIIALITMFYSSKLFIKWARNNKSWIFFWVMKKHNSQA